MTVAPQLPYYTVLVPLFGEANVVDSLLGALMALDYPSDKLDVKILLEASDLPMLSHFEDLRLPSHFEVLVVPVGCPQTKPRALNYGLLFARGTYLVIYDAEDIPEPQQLRLAAAQFEKAGSDVACLQAQLTFFNTNENWLTRQFSTEYSILFDAILPVLSAAKLPILLGGTSNHFRIPDLIEIGGWDPFNVTEDADIGLRLFRKGKRAAWLKSSTYEEAVTDYRSWVKQRSRWLKGFLQTWFVHMRHPMQLYRELGAAGFWIMQCMTVGVFLTALLHPLFLLLSLMQLATSMTGSTLDITNLTIINILSLFVFGGGYICSILLGAFSTKQRFGKINWFCLLTIPIYWLCAWPAALLALYDFVAKPHHWRKTAHGKTGLVTPN